MIPATRLRCNVGDTIYLAKNAACPYCRSVIEIRITKTGTVYMTQNARTRQIEEIKEEEFGFTAFVTKEAAIAALEGRSLKKWIQIWYSWGEQEAPVEVPEDVDAWEYMKKLVINEAEVSQEMHDEENGVAFFPEERKIVLHYGYDDQYCYYLITDTENFDTDDCSQSDEDFVEDNTLDCDSECVGCDRACADRITE